MLNTKKKSIELKNLKVMESAHILKMEKMVFYAYLSSHLLPWAGDTSKYLNFKSYYMNLKGILKYSNKEF